MEYEVRITLQAQAHLREIRDYIAQKLLAPEAARTVAFGGRSGQSSQELSHILLGE